MTSNLLPKMKKPFQKGSTLKGKNLLLEEQILSFKSGPILQRKANIEMIELLPLKVCPFTLSPKCLDKPQTQKY